MFSKIACIAVVSTVAALNTKNSDEVPASLRRYADAALREDLSGLTRRQLALRDDNLRAVDLLVSEGVRARRAPLEEFPTVATLNTKTSDEVPASLRRYADATLREDLSGLTRRQLALRDDNLRAVDLLVSEGVRARRAPLEEFPTVATLNTKTSDEVSARVGAPSDDRRSARKGAKKSIKKRRSRRTAKKGGKTPTKKPTTKKATANKF